MIPDSATASTPYSDITAFEAGRWSTMPVVIDGCCEVFPCRAAHDETSHGAVLSVILMNPKPREFRSPHPCIQREVEYDEGGLGPYTRIATTTEDVSHLRTSVTVTGIEKVLINFVGVEQFPGLARSVPASSRGQNSPCFCRAASPQLGDQRFGGVSLPEDSSVAPPGWSISCNPCTAKEEFGSTSPCRFR